MSKAKTQEPPICKKCGKRLVVFDAGEYEGLCLVCAVQVKVTKDG